MRPSSALVVQSVVLKRTRPTEDADMISGRAIMFAVSTLALAASIAWSAPAGPDSPRARLAVWLKDHGHPEMASLVEPVSPNALPGLPKDSQLPSQVIPPLP